MNQSDSSGSLIKPWPVLLDHYMKPLLSGKGSMRKDIVREALRYDSC